MAEIIHGPESLGPRVCAVTALPGHRLDLTFTNGERRAYDARGLLAYPAYRKLKDEGFFRSARVEYGSVCWPDDIDCCPDRLYADSVPLE